MEQHEHNLENESKREARQKLPGDYSEEPLLRRKDISEDAVELLNGVSSKGKKETDEHFMVCIRLAR